VIDLDTRYNAAIDVLRQHGENPEVKRFIHSVESIYPEQTGDFFGKLFQAALETKGTYL